MTEQEIAQSSAFKAINVLIDEHVAEMRTLMNYVKEQTALAFQQQYTPTIDTRTYAEDGANRGAAALPAAPKMLEQIQGTLADIASLRAKVSELQRFKLRLLNEYDFTHGDDTTQKKVFA